MGNTHNRQGGGGSTHLSHACDAAAAARDADNDETSRGCTSRGGPDEGRSDRPGSRQPCGTGGITDVLEASTPSPSPPSSAQNQQQPLYPSAATASMERTSPGVVPSATSLLCSAGVPTTPLQRRDELDVPGDAITASILAPDAALVSSGASVPRDDIVYTSLTSPKLESLSFPRHSAVATDSTSALQCGESAQSRSQRRRVILQDPQPRSGRSRSPSPSPQSKYVVNSCNVDGATRALCMGNGVRHADPRATPEASQEVPCPAHPSSPLPNPAIGCDDYGDGRVVASHLVSSPDAPSSSGDSLPKAGAPPNVHLDSLSPSREASRTSLSTRGTQQRSSPFACHSSSPPSSLPFSSYTYKESYAQEGGSEETRRNVVEELGADREVTVMTRAAAEVRERPSGARSSAGSIAPLRAVKALWRKQSLRFHLHKRAFPAPSPAKTTGSPSPSPQVSRLGGDTVETVQPRTPPSLPSSCRDDTCSATEAVRSNPPCHLPLVVTERGSSTHELPTTDLPPYALLKSVMVTGGGSTSSVVKAATRLAAPLAVTRESDALLKQQRDVMTASAAARQSPSPPSLPLSLPFSCTALPGKKAIQVCKMVDDSSTVGSEARPRLQDAPSEALRRFEIVKTVQPDLEEAESGATTPTDTNSDPILPPPPLPPLMPSFSEEGVVWGGGSSASAAALPTAATSLAPSTSASFLYDGSGGGNVDVREHCVEKMEHEGGNWDGRGSEAGVPLRRSSSLRGHPSLLRQRAQQHSRGTRGNGVLSTTTVTDTTARVSPWMPSAAVTPPSQWTEVRGSTLTFPVSAVGEGGGWPADVPDRVVDDGSGALRRWKRPLASQSAIIAAWNRIGARSFAGGTLGSGRGIGGRESTIASIGTLLPSSSEVLLPDAYADTSAGRPKPREAKSTDSATVVGATVGQRGSALQGNGWGDGEVQCDKRSGYSNSGGGAGDVGVGVRGDQLHQAKTRMSVLPVRHCSVLTRQRRPPPRLFPSLAKEVREGERATPPFTPAPSTASHDGGRALAQASAAAYPAQPAVHRQDESEELRTTDRDTEQPHRKHQIGEDPNKYPQEKPEIREDEKRCGRQTGGTVPFTQGDHPAVLPKALAISSATRTSNASSPHSSHVTVTSPTAQLPHEENYAQWAEHGEEEEAGTAAVVAFTMPTTTLVPSGKAERIPLTPSSSFSYNTNGSHGVEEVMEERGRVSKAGDWIGDKRGCSLGAPYEVDDLHLTKNNFWEGSGDSPPRERFPSSRLTLFPSDTNAQSLAFPAGGVDGGVGGRVDTTRLVRRSRSFNLLRILSPRDRARADLSSPFTTTSVVPRWVERETPVPHLLSPRWRSSCASPESATGAVGPLPDRPVVTGDGVADDDEEGSPWWGSSVVTTGDRATVRSWHYDDRVREEEEANASQVGLVALDAMEGIDERGESVRNLCDVGRGVDDRERIPRCCQAQQSLMPSSHPKGEQPCNLVRAHDGDESLMGNESEPARPQQGTPYPHTWWSTIADTFVHPTMPASDGPNARSRRTAFTVSLQLSDVPSSLLMGPPFTVALGTPLSAVGSSADAREGSGRLTAHRSAARVPFTPHPQAEALLSTHDGNDAADGEDGDVHVSVSVLENSPHNSSGSTAPTNHVSRSTTPIGARPTRESSLEDLLKRPRAQRGLPSAPLPRTLSASSSTPSDKAPSKVLGQEIAGTGQAHDPGPLREPATSIITTLIPSATTAVQVRTQCEDAQSTFHQEAVTALDGATAKHRGSSPEVKEVLPKGADGSQLALLRRRSVAAAAATIDPLTGVVEVTLTPSPPLASQPLTEEHQPAWPWWNQHCPALLSAVDRRGGDGPHGGEQDYSGGLVPSLPSPRLYSGGSPSIPHFRASPLTFEALSVSAPQPLVSAAAACAVEQRESTSGQPTRKGIPRMDDAVAALSTTQDATFTAQTEKRRLSHADALLATAEGSTDSPAFPMQMGEEVPSSETSEGDGSLHSKRRMSLITMDMDDAVAECLQTCTWRLGTPLSPSTSHSVGVMAADDLSNLNGSREGVCPLTRGRCAAVRAGETSPRLVSAEEGIDRISRKTPRATQAIPLPSPLVRPNREMPVASSQEIDNILHVRVDTPVSPRADLKDHRDDSSIRSWETIEQVRRLASTEVLRALVEVEATARASINESVTAVMEAWAVVHNLLQHPRSAPTTTTSRPSTFAKESCTGAQPSTIGNCEKRVGVAGVDEATFDALQTTLQKVRAVAAWSKQPGLSLSDCSPPRESSGGDGTAVTGCVWTTAAIAADPSRVPYRGLQSPPLLAQEDEERPETVKNREDPALTRCGTGTPEPRRFAAGVPAEQTAYQAALRSSPIPIGMRVAALGCHEIHCPTSTAITPATRTAATERPSEKEGLGDRSSERRCRRIAGDAPAPESLPTCSFLLLSSPSLSPEPSLPREETPSALHHRLVTLLSPEVPKASSPRPSSPSPSPRPTRQLCAPPLFPETSSRERSPANVAPPYPLSASPWRGGSVGGSDFGGGERGGRGAGLLRSPPAQPPSPLRDSHGASPRQRREPSAGQIVCRWCRAPYLSSTVCAVAQRPHSALREERRCEKKAKWEARQLLYEGRVAQAVALLKSAGICAP